jgi:hypothetical protein
MAEYVVPEGGLKAAIKAADSVADDDDFLKALEAFIRWQSEEAPVPTPEQCAEMLQSFALDGEARTGGPVNRAQARCIAKTWIRRMYLAPEPEVPEAIKDLKYEWLNGVQQACLDAINRRIGEAYRRGLKAGV